DIVRSQAVALIDALAVPSTGECLDNPRCFTAVLIQGAIELTAGSVIFKSGTKTDMIVELAAEIVVEATLGQAGEELAGQCDEAISTRENARCTSSGGGPNRDGSVSPTIAVMLSTAAIWAISPRSVRPPRCLAYRSTALEKAAATSIRPGWSEISSPSRRRSP